MKSFIFSMTFLLSTLLCASQTHLSASAISFEKSDKSIQVKPLSSDKNSSSFAIQIKDRVAAHYHKNHTETIVVLKGKAEMKIADSSFQIQTGDYINIPEGAIHSVLVKSKEPLEVISVQSPEFLGDDRHYVKGD